MVIYDEDGNQLDADIQKQWQKLRDSQVKAEEGDEEWNRLNQEQEREKKQEKEERGEKKRIRMR